MNTQLVATFTPVDNLEVVIDQIKTQCSLTYGRIFVLSLEASPEYILTYNIDSTQKKSFITNTILIHRKKDTNTLYTINALNQLVKSLNGGVMDKTFPVPWQNYSNSILLYEKDSLRILKTTLKFIR